MRDELLLYYERELTYLRRLGAEFAERYPKVAARLQLEPSKCEDPHVERLLEGFAFLAARVHRRLDDDIPELSESLLDVLYPQHVRPLPAMSIVAFAADAEQGRMPQGFRIARGSELRSRPVNGMPCRFRTVYDTTLWPLTVSACEWTSPERVGAGPRFGETVGAVRMELRPFAGVRLADVQLDALRLHVAGDTSVVDTTYELLCNSCTHVLVRDPDRPSRAPIVLPGHAVRPVGFGEDEGMFPYPRRSVRGYALLQELFAFPQKFYFVDVAGVGEAIRTLEPASRVEVSFLIAPFERAERRQILEHGLTPRTLRLGCTPVVNLFTQTAEPVLLSERVTEYPIIPDARRRLEVEAWSVDEVTLIRPGERLGPLRVRPLYSYEHGRSGATTAGASLGGPNGIGGNPVAPELFYRVVRRASGWRTDRGTELFLAFSDLSGGLRRPDVEVASVRLTCSNGDLPSRLPFGLDDDVSDFELVSGGPIARIDTLVKPTPAVQPPLGKSLLWRLVSTLSLNHLSLVEDGADALRELLRLHNAGDTLAGDRQIDGLVAVRSAPAFARVGGGPAVAFARGRKVEMDFDEEQFPGGGMFLFATVLERFLALYASMNSFTQLSVRSRQRRRVVREWAPRAGWKALL